MTGVIVPVIMIIHSQATAWLTLAVDNTAQWWLLNACAVVYGSVSGYRLATFTIQRTKP